MIGVLLKEQGNLHWSVWIQNKTKTKDWNSSRVQVLSSEFESKRIQAEMNKVTQSHMFIPWLFYICVYVCICMSVCACVYILPVCVFVCMCLCMCICVCACVYTYVHMCIYMCLCVLVCICEFACVCMCACVYIHTVNVYVYI